MSNSIGAFVSDGYNKFREGKFDAFNARIRDGIQAIDSYDRKNNGMKVATAFGTALAVIVAVTALFAFTTTLAATMLIGLPLALFLGAGTIAYTGWIEGAKMAMAKSAGQTLVNKAEGALKDLRTEITGE